MDILERIRALFGRQPGEDPAPPPIPAHGEAADPEQMLDGFMKMINNTRQEELGCDDVHALMAQYAELLARGEDPEIIMPMVKHHLEMCHECEEELEAVLEILETSR